MFPLTGTAVLSLPLGYRGGLSLAVAALVVGAERAAKVGQRYICYFVPPKAAPTPHSRESVRVRSQNSLVT